MVIPQSLRADSLYEAAATREAEAQSLLKLAAVFLSKPGEFSQAVGRDLAVQAAGFQGEAMRGAKAEGREL